MSMARAMAKRLLRRGDTTPAAPGPFNDHIPDTGPPPADRPSASTSGDLAWRERARELEPLARRHADESERLRRLADPLATEVIDRGIPLLMVPGEFGGHQASLVTAMEVVEELARQDGSLGWNVWVCAGHGRLADCMTKEAAHAVFATGRTLAGSVNPTGEATRVDGGYRLSGRWGFASACHLADWLVCGGTVDGDLTAFIVPVGDVQILDAWHTTGLRATGSEDFVVDDLFVPAEFTFDQSELWTVDSEDVAYGRPYSEYSPPLMAAVSLGIARHAIDDFSAVTAKKARQGDSRWDDVSSVVFDRIGHAEAMLQSCRSWLYELGALLDSLQPGDPSQGLMSRFTSSYVAETMSEAVRLLYDISGGRGIYARSEIERCFRDVQMVTHHALIGFATFADAGQSLVEDAI